MSDEWFKSLPLKQQVQIMVGWGMGTFANTFIQLGQYLNNKVIRQSLVDVGIDPVCLEKWVSEQRSRESEQRFRHSEEEKLYTLYSHQEQDQESEPPVNQHSLPNIRAATESDSVAPK